MDFEIVITLTVLVVAFLALTLDVWTPDAVLLTAVGVVTATGVISLDQATRQFGNTTIVALGSLYVIAAALQKSGALNRASVYILGKGKKSIRLILLRMSALVSVYSGFLNNTPIVAMEVSGAAEMIGNGMIEFTSAFGSRAMLIGIVLVTAFLTETITNNGAIALMFPIVVSMAESQGLEPRAFIVSVTIVSSMALLTPIGYQTNLMVYGPGNYKFTDFFKVGFPLAVVLWTVVIILTPMIWPF